MFLPNAWVSVYRDTPAKQTVDAWGQQVDDPAPTAATADATGLPAYISQSTQRVADPGSGTVTVVSLYKIRLRPRAFTFASSDRLKDERTNAVYQVNAVNDNIGTVQYADVVLICKRVT